MWLPRSQRRLTGTDMKLLCCTSQRRRSTKHQRPFAGKSGVSVWVVCVCVAVANDCQCRDRPFTVESRLSSVLNHFVAVTMVKAGTHYPYSHGCHVYSPYSRLTFFTPVKTGRELGWCVPRVRVEKKHCTTTLFSTRPVNTCVPAYRVRLQIAERTFPVLFLCWEQSAFFG